MFFFLWASLWLHGTMSMQAAYTVNNKCVSLLSICALVLWVSETGLLWIFPVSKTVVFPVRLSNLGLHVGCVTCTSKSYLCWSHASGTCCTCAPKHGEQFPNHVNLFKLDWPEASHFSARDSSGTFQVLANATCGSLSRSVVENS